MQIILNGKETEVDSLYLAELIESYKLKPDHVVAEVDGVIIDRSEWKKYSLKPGMKIELVHFVGGG